MKLGSAIVGEIINLNVDNVIDYSEIALDSLLEDGILKDIPLLSTIVAGYKTGIAIRDKRFVKKTLVFLQEISNGHTDTEALEQFKIKLENDEKYKQKVSELIATMIDNHLQEIQSKVLARLIISHINGEVNYERLVDLSITLDKLHPMGFDGLNILSRKDSFNIQSSDFPEYGFSHVYESLLFSAGLAHRSGTLFLVNDLGKELYSFGIRYLYE